MSRKLTVAIATGVLGAGLLLGAVGATVAGDVTSRGTIQSNGAAQVCDTSHMNRSRMNMSHMNQMMVGSMGDMMGSGMGSGMDSGLHLQHHGARP